jgi:hypothetical protein
MIKMLVVVECRVECLVAWVEWVEWECKHIFSSENSKNANGSNTFGVFFCLQFTM